MNDQRSHSGLLGIEGNTQASCVGNVSRRKFLAGAAALATGALLSEVESAAHQGRPLWSLALNREACRAQETCEPIADDLPRVDGLREAEVGVDEPAEPGRSVEIGDHEHPATSQHSRHFLHRTLSDGGG